MLDKRRLSDFPPDSNPFHHDAISVGMPLTAIGLPNVYVMDSATFGEGLYIVNAETGQRVKLVGYSQAPDNDA